MSLAKMLKASKQARVVCAHELATIRRTGWIYIASMTLWTAAFCWGLSFRKLPFPDFVLPLAAAYVQALIGMWVNLPLMKALRKGERCVRPGRMAWMLALGLLPLPLVYGVWLLLGYVDVGYITVMNLAATSMPRLYLSLALLVLGIVVLLYLFLAIGAFLRQMMIALIECERVRVGAIAKNALRHGFSPLKPFFNAIHWFLLMLLLLTGTSLLSWMLFSRPSVGEFFANIETRDMVARASLFLGYLMRPDPWLNGASFALSVVLILGGGFHFWPRYQLKRVCYQRLLLKQADILDE